MLSFTKNRDQPQNRQVCLTTPVRLQNIRDLLGTLSDYHIRPNLGELAHDLLRPHRFGMQIPLLSDDMVMHQCLPLLSYLNTFDNHLHIQTSDNHPNAEHNRTHPFRSVKVIDEGLIQLYHMNG